MYKQRQFQSHTTSENNLPKGLICKVCENKFLLYETFKTLENNIKDLKKAQKEQSLIHKKKKKTLEEKYCELDRERNNGN